MARYLDHIEMSEVQATTYLDRLFLKLKRVPTMKEFQAAGAIGSTGRLVALRHEWAELRGVRDQIKVGGAKRERGKLATGMPYVPKDVQATAIACREQKMPKAETTRYQGRPLEQPQLSPTVLALRDYKKAARNCGLSRSKS